METINRPPDTFSAVDPQFGFCAVKPSQFSFAGLQKPRSHTASGALKILFLEINTPSGGNTAWWSAGGSALFQYDS